MPDWAWLIGGMVGGLGMAACLYGMYGNKRRGFPALVALDSGFKSLDMRTRYQPGEVFACFDGVGSAGQRLLASLWRLDFVFILCFGVVMAVVTRNIAHIEWLRWVMMIAAILRGVMDVIENCLLLRVCGAYPKTRLEGMAKAAGTATLLKWAMMALWVLCLFVNLMLSAAALG